MASSVMAELTCSPFLDAVTGNLYLYRAALPGLEIYFASLITEYYHILSHLNTGKQTEITEYAPICPCVSQSYAPDSHNPSHNLRHDNTHKLPLSL